MYERCFWLKARARPRAKRQNRSEIMRRILSIIVRIAVMIVIGGYDPVPKEWELYCSCSDGW